MSDNCDKCGQWFVKDKEHICTIAAPLGVSVPYEKYGFTLDKLIFSIVSCDSGAGCGFRDFQFEMCSAIDRLKVKKALAEYTDVQFHYHMPNE